MRRFAFAVALTGLFALAILLIQAPKKINNLSDLEDLEVNRRVFIEGMVVEERVLSSGSRVLNLNNGFVLICACSKNFNGKFVTAEGVVSTYSDKKQVTALRIFANDS